MKKFILIIFILIANALYGANSESKIVQIIFNSLYIKNNFLIYAIEDSKINVLKKAGLKFTTKCAEADIIYVSQAIPNCKDKPIFTDNYKTFKNEKNAIGAFYWTKGRPNIYFLKSRLDRFYLSLPPKLKKYEMDEL